ncbi:MAG: hypothetical protein NXI30_15135 [bacterium]|nr:hypothetical protein [bacterium]
MARLLVAAIVSLTPATGFAGEEFQSADQAVMLTPGEIDNSQRGLTVIHSAEQEGVTDWRGGFDQPVDNTLIFSLTAEGAQHLNLIGGDQIAMIHGQVRSGADDTIIFAAPNGIYIGTTAIIDVGNLVAVGADLTDIDSIGGRDLELTGRVVAAPGSVIAAEENVLLYGTDVLLAGEIFTPGGRLLAVGADSIHFLDADTITEGLTNPMDLIALTGNGGVQNLGELTAETAALIGRRVVNTGHIEIEDGTLMMLGGEAVRLVEFDNPVVVEIPRANGPDNHVEAPEYAVENRGTIDAGRGRVRLAAADPLGWGIRQIAEAGGDTPSIRAGTIEIAGGENGRVEIAGVLDASDRSDDGLGGTIDVTGETIVLAGDVRADDGTIIAEGATLDASGGAGGGSIRVGGDELGKGELQRARGLVVAEGAEVRADAITNGDGGRVILFAESLTHIAGAVSARGGAEGGDGGFVETSGLERLSLETTPDLSAPEGEGGHWLIDPFSIRLVDEDNDLDCGFGQPACLNRAVEAILDPNFDSAGFDDVLRAIDFEVGGTDPNTVDVALIVRALSVGTDVTLSTEAFDPRVESRDEIADGAGNIDVEADILIPDGAAAPGTRATLTLLAAGDINIDANILVGDGDTTVTPNMSLGLVFNANDQAQRDPNEDFDRDQVNGDVNIRADMRTGGGGFVARGISVRQDAGFTLETDGGSVFLQSGSIDRFGNVGEFEASSRSEFDPTTAGISTGIDIDGTIDTARPDDDALEGGAITLEAASVNVRRRLSPTEIFIEAGELDVSGTLRSGGGAMSLRAGVSGTTSVGNARFDGATLDARFTNPAVDSDGGPISIVANRLDPEDRQLRSVDVVDDMSPDAQGGVIAMSGANDVRTEGGLLTIGSATTRSVSLEGTFDTTGGDDGENGLLAVFAGDRSGIDTDDDLYGNGEITIGGSTPTTLAAAGITLRARDVVTSTNAGAAAVQILASGESLQSLPFAIVGAQDDVNDGDDAFVTSGTLQIDAERQASFARNTLLAAETFDLNVAIDPTALTLEEQGTMPPTGFDPDVRLVFDGSGGANAAGGVRIQADSVSIETAPVLAVTSDLADPVDDRETELAREAGANYEGLQLRDFSGALRPEAVTITQAEAFAVTSAAATGDNEIFFGGRSGGAGAGGVFDTAQIGADGQRITLTSESGTLTIEDAAGLNDDAGRTPGADAGASWVTLNGGLLLDSQLPAPAVDFSSIVNPFDVASLAVTSPRSFTIDTSVTGAILDADELSFTAGRQTGIEQSGFDVGQLGGTLEVQAGLTLAATDVLSLHAGATGFGDLEFDSTGAPIRLQANSIALRAGAGGETEGSEAEGRSAIVGLAATAATPIELRDGAGGAFVADGTEKSFSFRQDAAIDAATHLPTIDQFGITIGNGFGLDDERVDYALQSDFGAIDLSTGGFDASQFRDVDITLIGRETGSGDAIQLPAGFVFDGRHVTLGGATRFLYTTELADAFAPAGTDADGKELTLRAGSQGVGSLTFQSGVVVRAPHIRLVSGDGSSGSTGSRVSVSGATFDLTDDPAAGSGRSFVFQEDQTFSESDLPDRDQFVESGGAPVLPSILVIRNDAGAIDWRNPDFTDLPLDLDSGAGRLVLEAEVITLRATLSDSDLVLTSDTGALANLRLRLRANDLDLIATGNEDAGFGRLLAGERAGDTTGAIPAGGDDTFDDERLLIEAFQADADATTRNLSDLAATEADPDVFDLAIGRGPESILVDVDGQITGDELFESFNVGGHLGRGPTDDAFGDDDPTDLFLFTSFDSDDDDPLDPTFAAITFGANNVTGSNLFIGNEFTPIEDEVFLETGAYEFGSVSIFTEGSIVLRPDTDIDAESIVLEAGFLEQQPFDEINDENPMGDLIFETSGAAASELTARRIALRAGNLRDGPPFRVTNRDFDGDGERDPLVDETPADDFRAEIDFSGLESISVRAGDGEGDGDTSLTVSSTADLDTEPIVAALNAGTGRFGRVELASVQAETTVADAGGLVALDVLANSAETLSLGSDEEDASLRIVLGAGTAPAPFSTAAGFGGTVELRSNDITIDATGAGVQLQLDDPNLRIVSRALRSDFDDVDELGRVASDPDVLERSRFTLIQDNDFSTTTLPRLDRYFRRGFAFGSSELETDRRVDLRFVEIRLQTDDDLVFTDDLRNGVIGSNLVLETTGPGGVLDLALTDFRPGISNYAFESLTDVENANNAAIELASFQIAGFDEVTVPDFAPTLAAPNGAPPTSDSIDFTVETTGDQLWDTDVRLAGTLDVVGRDLTFGGDVFRDGGAPIGAGLVVQTRGQVFFEGDLGFDNDTGTPTNGSTPAERLAFLHVLFDDADDADGRVQFGRRIDDDNGNGIDDQQDILDEGMGDPDFELPGDRDTIAETPIDEDRFVFVEGDTVFASLALSEPGDPTEADADPAEDFRSAIAGAVGLDAIESVLTGFREDGVGREDTSPLATIGQGAGNLTFRSTGGGSFVMASGERLAVAGDLRIDHAGQAVTLGDVAAGGANGITVVANEIGLVRRNAGVTFLPNGASTQDGGPVIVANALDFGGVTPSAIGRGKQIGFGLPDPFDPALPAFLSRFPAAAISADGTGLDASDFRFTRGSSLLDQVAAPIPLGASRSELTGAIPPHDRARADRKRRDLPPLQNPERMAELGVDARETPVETLVARLEGGAILDDTGQYPKDGNVPVTDSRLNPTDAEAAIALYESLFGSEGERAPEVKAVLQDALDRYRAQTRSRRIVGFELRRFVKNRPSTLLEAYGTLDQLDALFRYHRRLGLSRGEFRVIQREWLEAIQPEGITLDELSEAIHPSRYVRGSDILDIFGR